MYKKPYYQRSNRVDASNQGKIQRIESEGQEEVKKSEDESRESHIFNFFRCFSHLPNNSVDYENQKQKENKIGEIEFKNNGGSKAMKGDAKKEPADISKQSTIIQKMVKKDTDKKFWKNYIKSNYPVGSETADQYVERVILLLNPDRYNIDRSQVKEAAEEEYNFKQKKKINKKMIAEKEEMDVYKNMAKSKTRSTLEAQKQEKQIEKERAESGGSKDTKRRFEEKVEAENKAVTVSTTIDRLKSLASEQPQKWRKKGMIPVKRTGMDEEGRKHILSVLPELLKLLADQLETMGTTPETWRSQSEWVKLTKDKAPSALDSHIRVDLESAATIHGMPFYGKVRVQGNQEGRTWAGFFFQFYKPRITSQNIKEALELSLTTAGCYACIYDEDDNVPLPDGE